MNLRAAQDLLVPVAVGERPYGRRRGSQADARKVVGDLLVGHEVDRDDRVHGAAHFGQPIADEESGRFLAAGRAAAAPS